MAEEQSTNRSPGWPPGVRVISIDEMDRLGIGPDNMLYWDGREIHVEKRLTLEWWQTGLATITAFAALAVAIVDVGRSAGWWL